MFSSKFQTFSKLGPENPPDSSSTLGKGLISTRKVGGPRFLGTLPRNLGTLVRFLGRVPRNLTPPKIEEGQLPG